jgi:hypothetical protein
MATLTQNFDIHALALGSAALDAKKAEINIALRFLRSYFLQLADQLSGKSGCVTVTTEQYGRFCLEYAVARGDSWFHDGFNVVFYSALTRPDIIIASSKLTAAAEALPPHYVTPCYDLINQFVADLFTKHPPSNEFWANLKPLQDASGIIS